MKHFFIGSSIIRDTTKTTGDLQIRSRGGATVLTLVEQLSSYPHNSFSAITMVVGSNDCDCQIEEEKFMDNYNTLINHAKRISTGEVRISSVCPRVKGGSQYENKVKAINKSLKQLAEKRDCIFINNDTNFRLQDGKLDDSVFLGDGVHLNQRGTERLLKNLGLSSMAKYCDNRHLRQQRRTPIQPRLGDRRPNDELPQQQRSPSSSFHTHENSNGFLKDQVNRSNTGVRSYREVIKQKYQPSRPFRSKSASYGRVSQNLHQPARSTQQPSWDRTSKQVKCWF